MQRCEFCGSEQPIYAYYCGNCGHMLGDGTRPATGIAHPQTPPLFSNPPYSITTNPGTGQEYMDPTVQSSWPEWGTMQNSPQFPERHVTWNCVPPKLAVSPGLFARTDCQYTGQGWSCTATLTNLDSLRSLDWSSSSSGIKGITFTHPSGTIPVNQSVPVTIFVPNTTCPAQADLVFTGPLNTVHVPWGCQPSAIQVSPAKFNANTDCSYATDTSSPGWTCQATITDADSQLSASWSASAPAGITFTPASGSVSPGAQPAQVSIFVPEMTCPATITLTFTGPANLVNVPWSCSAPSLSVAPSGITANTDCSYSANTSWTCSATLSSSSSNQGDLAWSAASSGLRGISFSQPNGTLSPGTSKQIQIFVSAATICPASASLAFSGRANTISVSWSCATPTLSVSPSSLGLDGKICHSGQTGYTCTVTLSDDQGGANWTASSDIKGVNISPSSGTVYPGGTTITISNIPCGSATFSFIGPTNTATASWICIS